MNVITLRPHGVGEWRKILYYPYTVKIFWGESHFWRGEESWLHKASTALIVKIQKTSVPKTLQNGLPISCPLVGPSKNLSAGHLLNRLVGLWQIGAHPQPWGACKCYKFYFVLRVTLPTMTKHSKGDFFCLVLVVLLFSFFFFNQWLLVSSIDIPSGLISFKKYVQVSVC